MKDAEIRKEIIQDLQEWGIDKNRSHHKIFYKKVIERAVEYSKHDHTLNFSSLKSDLETDVFPRNISEAIRCILHNELESSKDFTFWDMNCKLGSEGFQPFYHRYDGTLGKQKWASKFKRSELDPMDRFEGIEYSSKDWFRKMWNSSTPSYSPSPMLEGNICEALVAHHMIYEMQQCYSCKCRHGLRWNGGFDTSSSWADVICVKCSTSYEIKSTASNEKVERNIKFDSFRGGSFRMFYNNADLYTNRYIVIVSRAETYVRSERRMALRVSLAKIRQVQPRLCAESFLDTHDNSRRSHRIRIISNISIAKSSLILGWCFVQPFHDEDHIQIAREVFENIYGAGSWSYDKIDNAKDDDEAGPHKTSGGRTAPVDNGTNDDKNAQSIESLRQELNDLKVDGGAKDADNGSDDDWETLFE